MLLSGSAACGLYGNVSATMTFRYILLFTKQDHGCMIASETPGITNCKFLPHHTNFLHATLP